MPHKAVAESLTPPNRILLTCNRVHNAFVSHGKRRRDFFYYNKKDYRSSSVKIKITNKTMEFSLACKYQTEAKRTIKISLGWVSAEATFKVVSKGS